MVARPSFVRDELRYAVWLVPDASCAAPYEQAMAELRSRWGGPTFRPHLTLTSGLKGSEDEVITRFQELAQNQPQLRLPAGRLLVSGEHYQAVIITATVTPELAALRHRYRSAWGLDEASFRPHLSLVYGSIPNQAWAGIEKDWAEHPWPDMAIGRLALWRLQGEVEDWQAVASAELDGQAVDQQAN
jgi:2'-5' RNA ligase